MSTVLTGDRTNWHLIDAVAPVVERILYAALNVDLLVTSREPLLVETEWVHRLQALRTPPEGVELTARHALEYAAVQLLVERAMSSLDSFVLDDAHAGTVANLCRRLDGSPLAIELVAARADLFGVAGLEKALDDLLLLLTRGRRTHLARQQSLRGALDWSYVLLTTVEQTILRRVSVFRCAFSLETAIAVVANKRVTTGPPPRPAIGWATIRARGSWPSASCGTRPSPSLWPSARRRWTGGSQ